MLEEMRKAPLVPLLVLGTNVVPEACGYKRELRLVPQKDIEAVVESHLGKVDFR
jgi:hypothetical protein